METSSRRTTVCVLLRFHLVWLGLQRAARIFLVDGNGCVYCAHGSIMSSLFGIRNFQFASFDTTSTATDSMHERHNGSPTADSKGPMGLPPTMRGALSSILVSPSKMIRKFEKKQKIFHFCFVCHGNLNTLHMPVLAVAWANVETAWHQTLLLLFYSEFSVMRIKYFIFCICKVGVG